MKALFSSRPDSIWDERALCAFVIAPIFPALLAAAYFGSIELVGLCAFISYPHMPILAIPFAFLLNLHRKISLGTVAFLSFLIGAIPATIYHIYSILHPEDGTNRAFGMTDVPRTAEIFIIFGGLGVSAGVAWWLIALLRKPIPQTA